MCVDSAGRLTHPLFGLLALPTQFLEGVAVAAVLRTQQRRLTKIWIEGATAVKEGRFLHIAVCAAVLPVDQSRLGCGVDLIQQRTAGGGGDVICAATHQLLADNLHGAALQLPDVMRLASCTNCRLLLTQQTASGRQTQLLPRNFGGFGGHHVDVKQPTQRAILLDLGHQAFYLQRLQIGQQAKLVPCRLMDLLLLQNFCACKLQLKQDAFLAQRKGVGKQRKAFDTACNI